MSAEKRSSTDLVALKHHILNSLNLQEWFEGKVGTKLKVKVQSGWCEHVKCIFHNDTGKPNLSVNIKTGGFRCFACGKAGSLFDFWCYLNGRNPKTDFQDALISLANEAGIDIGADRPLPAIPEDAKTKPPSHYAAKVNKADTVDARLPPLRWEEIAKYQANLEPDHYKFLHFQRGLTVKTIQKYKLGLNKELKYKDKEGSWKRGKITIPIPNKNGECRNVRVYSIGGVKEFKMINTEGYGSPPRIFPLTELIALKPSKLLYCEGEFDCMLMNQKLEEHGLLRLGGWLAVTNTGGCSCWEDEWLPYFQGTEFIFLYDVDPAGKQWAQAHASEHLAASVSSGNIRSVQIVHLPLAGTPDSNDITDYFVKENRTFEDLLDLIDNANPLEKGGVGNDDMVEPCIDVDDLRMCVKNREYIDRRIRVSLTINGQTSRLYHAPRTLRVVSCPVENEEECCARDLVTIPYGDVSFIEACMARKRDVKYCLQELACIKGKPCHVEEVEKVVMEEYYAHQLIKRMTVRENQEGRMVNSQELVMVPLYILQPPKNQEIGPQDYMITGYVRSHPLSRQACLFVETMEPMEEDWKKFEITGKVIESLQVIQSFEKVGKILDELANGVTQVYQSDEIMLTILLTYLTPRYFNFNNQIIRGWINSCIIGDTGTGKTKTYTSFSDWVNVGDTFSALSGKRTGLLYAIKSRGSEWYVQIGRYVMASGKVLAIDETQESDPEDIKKMGKAMDEGWLQVEQVASGGYKTETRTLFLMNPKGGKKISDFPYGCMALAECFHPMFIRRLDISVFAAGRENPEFYNKEHAAFQASEMKLTPDVMRTLIYWAWTRTIDEVKWDFDTTKFCLGKAVEMSKVYGHADDVPLIIAQDCRNKLARLATAYAVLSGSFTEDYTGVVVKEDHVHKVSKFLDLIYSSNICNLRQHAKNSGRRKVLAKTESMDEYDAIEKVFIEEIRAARDSPDRRIKEGDHFLQIIWLMQQQQCIRLTDLSHQVKINPRWTQRYLSLLVSHDLIEFKRGEYIITRKFNLFMHRWQENEEVEKLLECAREKIGQISQMEAEYAEDFFPDPELR